MKIEQQVCSLELAKKLKELGFEQESVWVHRGLSNNNSSDWFYSWNIVLNHDARTENKRTLFYSAYTVAELGEMLPETVYTQRYLSRNHPTTDGNKSYIDELRKNNWYCIRHERDMDKLNGSDTEANARAKMLIYLKENNLI